MQASIVEFIKSLPTSCCLPNAGFLHHLLFDPEDIGGIFVQIISRLSPTKWYYIPKLFIVTVRTSSP
jgi:hypothetical protein